MRQKVVEQEETLRQAEARVNELQAKLDNSGPPGDASTQAAIDQLQKKHAEELKLQETNLLEQHQKQLKEAVEAAVIKIKESAGAGTGANGGVNAEDIEMRIQERLSAVEKEREAEQAQAIQAAVEAREQALKAEHQAALQARYNTAHEEARLRNQVMIKMKDAKIEKLNAQLAELKGEGPGTGMPGQAKPAVVTSAAPVAPGVPTAPAAAPASNAAAGPSRPAVAQIGRGGAAVARGGVPAGRGRGGVPASPTLPQRPNAGAGPTDGQAAAPQGAAARGGANAQGRGAPRGRGRGGALQAATAAAAAAAPGAPGANAAKRKLDQGVTSTAANGEGDGGNAAKRVKPAGAPVAINRPPVQRPGGGGSPGAGGNQRATGA